MEKNIDRMALKTVVGMLRINYPKGTRVELVKMDDVQAPPLGTLGTVNCVDDLGTIMVEWDNGVRKGLVFGMSECRIIGYKKNDK